MNPPLVGLEKNSKLLINKVEQTVDGSFEIPENDGDDTVQGEKTATIETEPNIQENFDFKSFESLMEFLSNDIEIGNACIDGKLLKGTWVGLHIFLHISIHSDN